MGWIGTASELAHFLSVSGCDTESDGRFRVGGPQGAITSFLGIGDEFCVSDDAVYFVEGNKVPLASGLCQTSYGVRIEVIA